MEICCSPVSEGAASREYFGLRDGGKQQACRYMQAGQLPLALLELLAGRACVLSSRPSSCRVAVIGLIELSDGPHRIYNVRFSSSTVV